MAKPKVRQHTSQQHFQPKNIKPLTDNQSLTFDLYKKYGNLVLHGVAGTGKTFIAMYLAIQELLSKDSSYDKIVIIRSAVPTRDVGFLPGTLDEKMAVYEQPYKVICDDLFGRGDAYGILKHKGQIEFESTSFLRGTTFNNCIIIVDEMQNLAWKECDTIITRVGDNSKIVFCGDYIQSDLESRDRNGIIKFLDVLESMNCFGFVDFVPDDIVRSGLCKSYIFAKLAKGL